MHVPATPKPVKAAPDAAADVRCDILATVSIQVEPRVHVRGTDERRSTARIAIGVCGDDVVHTEAAVDAPEVLALAPTIHVAAVAEHQARRVGEFPPVEVRLCAAEHRYRLDGTQRKPE